MLDLIIKNGHIVDPANGIDGVGNVCVYNGRIVEADQDAQAAHEIDATGLLVVPGLIDSHAHMFAEGTDIGIYPDAAYLPTGVTAAIDASAGASNYRLFRSSIVERSRVTIKSFLQVCSAGLVTSRYHEDLDPDHFDEKKIAAIYRDNSDNIIGLKIRQSEELVNGKGIEPLRKTIEIAERIGCPVEVHCTNIPVPTECVLDVLRPGDIFEHVYQGVKNTIIDEETGHVRPCVEAARERGIIFDTAEGRKHGDFQVMLAALEDGFVADMCSTDLVLGSMYRRPIFSLPNLMSRYICMGISLYDVVSMTTEVPAKLMGMRGKIGCLSQGAHADIAIFDWRVCKQRYRDWKGTTFDADHLLVPQMTIKDGQILYCAPDWIYEGWARP